MAKSAELDVIAQEADRERSKHLAAEKVAQRRIKGQTQPDDILVYASIGVETRDEIEAFEGRVKRADELKAQAGSKAEYEAAKKQLADDTATLSAKRPVIEGKIGDLQRELSGLEAQLAKSTQALFRKDQALSMLPRVVPPYLKRQYELEMKAVQDRFQPLKEAMARVTSINGILELKVGEHDRDIFLQANSLKIGGLSAPFVVETKDPVTNEIKKRLDATAWQQYQDELRTELAATQTKIETMKVEQVKAIAEADKLLDFYLPA